MKTTVKKIQPDENEEKVTETENNEKIEKEKLEIIEFKHNDIIN